MPMAESIVTAINTSGRAVLFAGTTVCIAILGLIALGVSFFNGMAVATALAVAFTMAASLTLLPALLSLFGLKVLPRRQRAAVRAGEFIDGEPVGFWARWSEFIAKRKIVVAIGAAVVMIALAIPFFSLELGNSDQSSDPKGSTTRIGYDLISSEFGVGYNSTLEAVVNGPARPIRPTCRRCPTPSPRLPASTRRACRRVPLTKSIAFVTFKTTTSPQSEKTYQLVRHVRANVLPPLYKGTANHIYTYGNTAINVDFAKVLARKMPLFIAVVVGPVVPPADDRVPQPAHPAHGRGDEPARRGVARSGWGSRSSSSAGARTRWAPARVGPIDAWIPVMLFAILFGLSMDYQVFLVSRMHEEWVHTESNRRAVTVGQAETGGIITAAALIMIAVFLGLPAHPRPPDQDLRHGPGHRGVPRRLHPADHAGAVADAHASARPTGTSRAGSTGSSPACRSSRPKLARPVSPRRLRHRSSASRPVRTS